MNKATKPDVAMDDQELNDRVETLRRLRIEMAREDVNVFAELVLRDERTGGRIKQGAVHRRMHAALDSTPRAVLWGFVESGKSETLVTARIVHALGRDPTLRIGLVGNTAMQAQGMLRKIATLIETNPDVRAVFPHLQPSKPWREDAITVARTTGARDPSVRAFGALGNVLGARLDMIVCDDLVDLQNSSTEHGRASLREWVLGTLIGRCTEGGRVYLIGNAFHPSDLMHELEKLPSWRGFRFPVLDADGKSVWPERWSAKRIEERRAEQGPLEFARTMLCQPRSEEDARFKRTDIDVCIRAGMGLGNTFARSLEEWRPAMHPEEKRMCAFYTGIDLAVQIHNEADRSAIFTIAVHPDGMREIVDLESGRWAATDILAKIGATYRKWGSVVIIENVAAQEWMRQFAATLQGVPSMPFTTGRGKASLPFQAEGLSTEISSHRWVIPCSAEGHLHPEVAEWVTALLFYSPLAHTPDRMAASLFARHGAMQGERAAGAGAPRIVGERLDGRRGCWG